MVAKGLRVGHSWKLPLFITHLPCIFSELGTRWRPLTDLMKKAIAVLCFLIIYCQAYTQSGTLDAGWGINGKLTANLGFSYFRV